MTFGERASAQVMYLPSAGKRGRRNWHLRSLRDKPFHSTLGMSGVGSDGLGHAARHPANAET